MVELSDAIPKAVKKTGSAGTGTKAARDDHVHALDPNLMIQKVTVSKAGTQKGKRPNLNLIEGTGVALTVEDNSPEDRVDVTVTAEHDAQKIKGKTINDSAIGDGKVLVYRTVGDKLQYEAQAGGDAHQAKTAKGTTNTSTSSTSWVDIADMSITITTGNNPVLVIFSMSVVANPSGGGVDTYSYFRLLVDGTPEAGLTVGQAHARVIRLPVAIHFLKTLTAGSHTIKAQWNKGNGWSGTLVNSASAASEHHRTLTVIELKS